MIDKEGCVR